MIDKNYKGISITEQCKLLDVSKSTFYYTPKPECDYGLAIMAKIDELYMKRPYLGSRGMTRHLKRLGYIVNRKRIKRLMKKMGIAAIYL